MKNSFLTKSIISGLGSGYVPVASGTFGSIACLFIWYLLSVAELIEPGWKMLVVIILVTAVGYIATANYLKKSDDGQKDPKEVVIDEWAGLLVALCYIKYTNTLQVLIAFCLFRFFDIIKPGPISKAEKQPGALGVMLDDLLAGIVSAIILAIYDVSITLI